MADKQTESQQTETRIIETKDGDVKVVQPFQPKGRKRRGVTVLFDTDDVVREQVGGFTNFLREYAVVGLAVGFIVGQQANAVVKQLVSSFVDPLVQVWLGQDLSSRVAIVHHHHQPVKLPWGAFVYTLIEFFLVLITVYLLIKLFKLDKLRPKDTPKK